MNDVLASDALIQFSELSGYLEQLLNCPAPSKPLVRIERPVPAMNLLGWLSCQRVSCQRGYSRSYWQDRDKDYQIAGLGRSWTRKLCSRNDIEPAFNHARELLNCLPNPDACQCFSYLSFSDDSEQIWSEFGYGVLFLPMLDVTETRAGTTLAINLRAGTEVLWRNSIQQAQELLASVVFQQSLDNTAFHLTFLEHLPNHTSWKALMGRAFRSFDSGNLDKVVLSRESTFDVYGELSPWYLMQCWQQANPYSYNFIFEGDDLKDSNLKGSNQKDGNRQVFLGCSPEKLMKRQGTIITSEALAGTSRRGRNEEEDIQLERLLMNDLKNIHENCLVLDDIRLKLTCFCQTLETDRSHSILKLKTVQHLRYLIRGVLNEQANDACLIKALHPTPAVGGTPGAGAGQFIDQNEPYNRGLYAGACGVLGVERSEFSVAIRSARLTPNQLSLYAGAGIVKDSDAQEEWQELDNKVTTILNILNSIQI